ncbi:uncharacterized protein [Euphorbia lathyris]|uniref:uncharacterized protein isoform X2 n=1 Tax=Euphorbia lathyris TaxID=212925 RepID=UPI0033144B80
MHDILREFAVSISSNAEDPYVIKCENIVMTKWPETTKYKNCTAISIMCKKMQEHPVDLECPKLELLQLAFGKDSNPLHAGIFEGMKDLKVLSLKVPSLLQSLTVSKKLRALFIRETGYSWGRIGKQEIDLIGDHLINLEFLSFCTGRPFKDFPVEIGLMCNLRVLRFRNLKSLQQIFVYIPPGVLSKLVKLEELYLPLEFQYWGCKEYGGERINANLDEIESLPLTALEIGVRKGSILAEKFVKNLTRFEVHVEHSFSRNFRRGDKSKTLLDVVGVDACDITASWISALLRKSECLRLTKVVNLNNITCLQLENNGFEQLKKMEISDCEEMEYLVNRADQLESLKLRRLDNLKEICHIGPSFSKIEAPLCFPNLIRISIWRCAKLKSVFPLSVARGLSQLQQIHISECDEMEKVIYTDEVDDDDNQQEAAVIAQFSPTPETTSTLKPTVDTNHNKPNLICPMPNSIIRGLIGRGKRPKSVSNQQQVEENSGKDDEKQVIIFPQLKVLQLGKMPKFRVFYDGNHPIILPSFESLSIYECNEMEAFSYGSCTTPILQQILINIISHPAGEDVNAFFKDIMWPIQDCFAGLSSFTPACAIFFLLNRTRLISFWINFK